MRILVSTFGGDDEAKVLSAMRSMQYEKLVLIGDGAAKDADGFRRLARLEEMSGNHLVLEPVDTEDFMGAVEDISSMLARLSRDPATGRRNPVALNISGGSKLLGDAALFSAFRLGIEAYNCEEHITRLPVLKGATTVDRFTPSQIRFISSLRPEGMPFEELLQALRPASRQSVERTLRMLRKEGLIVATLVSGKARVQLSAEGMEVARALRIVGASMPSNVA